MRGYSLDIRERVVKAVKEEKQTKSHVAKRFGISRWTVNRYLKRDEAGNLEATKPRGRPQTLDVKAVAQLEKQVREHPNWTREDHAAALSKSKLGNVKRSSIGNYLKRLGISFKKEDIVST